MEDKPQKGWAARVWPLYVSIHDIFLIENDGSFRQLLRFLLPFLAFNLKLSLLSVIIDWCLVTKANGLLPGSKMQKPLEEIRMILIILSANNEKR